MFSRPKTVYPRMFSSQSLDSIVSREPPSGKIGAYHCVKDVLPLLEPCISFDYFPKGESTVSCLLSCTDSVYRDILLRYARSMRGQNTSSVRRRKRRTSTTTTKLWWSKSKPQADWTRVTRQGDTTHTLISLLYLWLSPLSLCPQSLQGILRCLHVVFFRKDFKNVVSASRTTQTVCFWTQ